MDGRIRWKPLKNPSKILYYETSDYRDRSQELLKFVKDGVIRPTGKGTAHIPKIIREHLGTEIRFLLYDKVAVLYNPNATDRKVLKILNILSEKVEDNLGKK